MPTPLSLGKWNLLKKVSTPKAVFSMVAFDQRGSYVRMLPEATPFQEAVRIKRTTVQALSAFASAFLLDPEYGLEPALHLHRNCGLILALEKSGYSGDDTRRRTELYDRWTVAKIKRAGAQAVKLLVYYHPEAGALTDEIEELCRRLAAECRGHDIPFFLEPVLYSLDAATPKASEAFARRRPELVRETARRLSGCGADILKLEFPVDTAFDADGGRWDEACRAVSEASAVPWVLLSAGVDFEVFARQLGSACRGGASGFLAGRAIWKEGVALPAVAQATFLQDVALPRLQRLSAIVEGQARPWTGLFTPPPIAARDAYAHYDLPAGWSPSG